MTARRTSPRRHLFWWLLVVAIIGGLLWLAGRRADAPGSGPAGTSSSATQPSSDDNQPVKFDKSRYSLSDPASQWVVVNKQRPLQPRDYHPKLVIPDVKLKGSPRAENMHVGAAMAPQLEALFAAAKAAGQPLMLSSGYRSYKYQVKVYNQQVKQYGQSKADDLSARPGYSEHQTGWAADVAPINGHCDLSECFGSTSAGRWLAASAYRYGFIIRYPEGKRAITGYDYEPWHIRYIGIAAATAMHQQGISTLEEFFDLPAAPTY